MGVGAEEAQEGEATCTLRVDSRCCITLQPNQNKQMNTHAGMGRKRKDVKTKHSRVSYHRDQPRRYPPL